MFNFLRQLLTMFSMEETPETFGLGALENPRDPRDVQTSAFQPENKLPEKHITDISMLPRYDQKSNGSCVGHAIALALAYYEYKENGKLDPLSPRFIYGLSKKRDGLASEGTYPRIGGLVALEYGCATDKTLPNSSYLPHSEYITFELDNSLLADSYPRKIKGFAFASETEEALKNAIINNGVVCVSLNVGRWSRLPVKSGDNGRHYILVYGYNKDRFYFANSWGKNWGDKKLGDGYFVWNEFKDSIRDIMVITDIPNKVMQEAKAQWKYKYFKPTEKTGSMGTCADLKAELLDYVDELRGVANIPFKPTSGFRTPEQNAKVGGSKNSSHLRGLAMDIACTTKANKDIILNAVKKLEKKGKKCFLEIANSHVHIDVDSSIHQLGKVIYVDDE